MGRTARDSKKADTPIKVTPTQDLEARIDRAWREGPMSELDRNQFILYVIKLGIQEHERIYADARREAEPFSKPTAEELDA